MRPEIRGLRYAQGYRTSTYISNLMVPHCSITGWQVTGVRRMAVSFAGGLVNWHIHSAATSFAHVPTERYALIWKQVGFHPGLSMATARDFTMSFRLKTTDTTSRWRAIFTLVFLLVQGTLRLVIVDPEERDYTLLIVSCQFY